MSEIIYNLSWVHHSEGPKTVNVAESQLLEWIKDLLLGPESVNDVKISWWSIRNMERIE